MVQKFKMKIIGLLKLKKIKSYQIKTLRTNIYHKQAKIQSKPNLIAHMMGKPENRRKRK